MPALPEAVEEAAGGARLLVEVQAGARETAFPDGFNRWRGRVGVRVRAPAERGRANEEVVRLLAAFFALPASRVVIESGATQPRKAVRLLGLDRAAVLELLAASLGAP